MKRTAVVVGSGPNGLSAAIAMARAGWDVEVREAAPQLGGAVSTYQLTLPGFLHDMGSAVHPMAISSPFFAQLPLRPNGLRWIWSPLELAHPLDDGSAAFIVKDVRETAAQFKHDAGAWIKLFEPLAKDWRPLIAETLQPMIHIPRHPFLLARFGMRAVLPASVLIPSAFRDERARALFAGLAAHSVLPFYAPLSSAFAFMLGAAAHAVGWPIPEGGSQNITNALAAVLKSYGGRVTTSSRVGSLNELASADLSLLDITPKQLLQLSDGQFSSSFRRSLRKFKYGPGLFKVDWALRQPIPWKAPECRQAITVHLGGSFEEIAASERDCWKGRPPTNPFIILAQQSLFDPSRAPEGQHTAWAYCHVPNGWNGSALQAIENQVERFAPGFRDCVLARCVHSPKQMEDWNSNLVGGDVNAGAPTPLQFIFRPTWRQYRTPSEQFYLCSASTPPGGGVHGMCGYNAAQAALADHAGNGA